MKKNNYRRILMVLFLAIFFALSISFSSFFDFIPRLSYELGSGGLRTVNSLLSEHFHVLNNSVFEHLVGTSNYIFDGNSVVRSDIGWVIIYNYSGLFGVLIVFFMLLFFCYRAFGFSALFFLWIFSAVWMNTKGLIVSPNSFVFMLSIFIFFNFRSVLKNACKNNNTY